MLMWMIGTPEFHKNLATMKSNDSTVFNFSDMRNASGKQHFIKVNFSR